MGKSDFLTRRDFSSLLLASGLAACIRDLDSSHTPVDDDLIQLSARDAVRLMRDGSLSAEEYARVLLDRCEEGSHLNAFITLEPERILDAARAADKRRASWTGSADRADHRGPAHKYRAGWAGGN